VAAVARLRLVIGDQLMIRLDLVNGLRLAVQLPRIICP
jgi:hypothetical protein